MTPQALIAFEEEVATLFEAKMIPGPIHLSGGNEEALINIFSNIRRDDWVFSTWRNHYHALLHGVPRDEILEQIIFGRSMNFSSPKHKFFTSAIVGGICPPAVGVAAACKRRRVETRVHCFVGDMAACTGVFHEARSYAEGHNLPVMFYVEDNGMSTNTPTMKAWGEDLVSRVRRYPYTRKYPHTGVGKWIQF
jgi:pyruvate dehydrogenase E1 component alpha subunit